MKNKDINLKDLPRQLSAAVHKLGRIAPLLFLVVVAALYGFLLVQIMLQSNIQPDDSEVTSEISKLSPHIDQQSASQLQTLEDHSVNVKALFNDARKNPFGE